MPEKRGRKKKESPVVKEKKKRGRKPAFEYYSTSACKREINARTESVVNNCIIQLDISDTEDTCSIQPLNSWDSMNKSVDVIERYYDELQNDQTTSLEELYNTELEERKKQDNNFYKELEHKKFSESLEVNNQSTIIENVDNNCVNILNDFIEHSWPSTTNVKCWWCCHTFTGVPIGIPIKFDKNKKKFIVKGIFCDWGCMYAYLQSSKYSKIINIDSLINDMYIRFTGASIKDKIVPALPRETLVDFGGTLSIDIFRDHSKNRRIYNRIDYPLTVMTDIIQVKDIEKIKKRQETINEGTDLLPVKETIIKPIQRQTIDSIIEIEYD